MTTMHVSITLVTAGRLQLASCASSLSAHSSPPLGYRQELPAKRASPPGWHVVGRRITAFSRRSAAVTGGGGDYTREEPLDREELSLMQSICGRGAPRSLRRSRGESRESPKPSARGAARTAAKDAGKSVVL